MADAQVKAGKAQQFSESESKLIAELRVQLPEILQDAEKVSEKPVSKALWGVELLPAEATERDLRIDVILAKFIRARNNDLKLAREMLVNTLKWRAEFGVEGILQEEFPKDVFGNVGYLYGHDNDGRPVTYNFYGGLDNKKVFGDLDQFLRWRVQLHERGMQQLDFVDVADMVQVHDYEGVGLLSYDKFARAASKATVQLMSDNYPETLATKIFANVPGWGETIFNIIGRWLSDETKKKFVVVSKATAPSALAQRIGNDIPEKFRAKSETADKTPEPTAADSEAGLDTDNNATKTKTEDASAQGTATLSAPAPEPAHIDAAEALPKPTDTAKEQQSAAAVADSQPGPEPATVTAAPEAGVAPAEPNDIISETAGMPELLPADRKGKRKAAESKVGEVKMPIRLFTADENYELPKMIKLKEGTVRRKRRKVENPNQERFDLVRQLLSMGVSAKGARCSMGLVVAAKAGNMAMVRLLLKNGADAMAGGDNKALLMAVVYGHIDVAKRLVKSGAQISSLALRYAVQKKRSDITAWLMKKGAVPDMATIKLLDSI
ncbi:Non-classical phosphatidylinositol transfer protein (PITP) [Coemansia sp. RSA 1085]|nr:Non-classical phosphatidylinositol transfer protein (PITP) [Coemansia sp. RSA 1085]